MKVIRLTQTFPVAAAACMLCLGHASARDAREIAPPMAIGLGGVSGYTSAWQFTDMMKHSREWRVPKGFEIVEDFSGWPRALRGEDGKDVAIGDGKQAMMWLYNRRIAGDIVLTWEGDGEVAISRRESTLVEDNYPERQRRVYHWDDRNSGVFDVVVLRSNPANHVRNIRMWMPGFENAESPFHPLFKKRIEPFPYFRFMDWGATNNSEQKEWSDRKDPRHMRQTGGVAYEYMIQLCNEMERDMWVCIPHMATDDYVRQLADLLKKQLDPGRKIYVEYSNEIWNGAFHQTRYLWDVARKEGHTQAPWEFGATLCGRRSAQIWKVMDTVLGEPDRLVRVITHFRWLDKCMEAAKDPANGSGRVDLIALNGYFISQDALTYTLRGLEQFDVERVIDDIEQFHLLGQAASWLKEIGRVKEQWGLPVTCYEGGQHFANPFSSGLQGKQLVECMFAVNGHPRIRDLYRTALETWHLAGGDGFTAFVDCGNWGKYGCWGHLQYQEQPLEDVIDPATGEIVEKGAAKYVALMDYIERRSGQDTQAAPVIDTITLSDATVGEPYTAELSASGGKPPYRWSLLGGRLPEGLAVSEDGMIGGTARKDDQLVCIVNATDAAGQHASKVLGLFIDPSGELSKTQTFEKTEGGALPEGWDSLGAQNPYLPLSAGSSGYTAEIVCAPKTPLSIHARIGLAVNLTPDGDAEDYLRIAIDGPGRKVQVYSRYVKDGKGELWRPRDCALLPDEGEGEDAPAFDPGELWRIRVTARPASSPGAIDVLVGVFDENGESRLDPSDRYDVANGIWLLRELALKEALLSGPFGLMSRDVDVKSVSWSLTK